MGYCILNIEININIKQLFKLNYQYWNKHNKKVTKNRMCLNKFRHIHQIVFKNNLLSWDSWICEVEALRFKGLRDDDDDGLSIFCRLRDSKHN